MIQREQRLPQMWRSCLAVGGLAALAIILPGPFAAAQQLTVGQARATSQQLSEKVRQQILKKLAQGTQDRDAEIANHSRAGLAPAADAQMATQALVALLDRPAPTQEAMLEKLHFAGCLIAHEIAREKVVTAVLEAAKSSEYAAVRLRAINVLMFAAAGNSSADVVHLLIKTAKNSESQRAALSSIRPGGSSNASEWAIDRPVVKSLITRATGSKTSAEADRAERLISTFLFATQCADEARADAEFAALIDRYNRWVKQDRWSEAKLIAKRAQEVDPKNPISQIMYEKARIGYQVARNALLEQSSDEDKVAENKSAEDKAVEDKAAAIDSLLVLPPLDSELLAPAAVAAIAHIVPQTDEVAVALMEALKCSDVTIRRAASRALANAMDGSTEGGSSAR